ncbi:MAG: hypothetical protein HND47_16675 [Chloroflexi bacterium]|nr:hypothetical protein [Chloroflexota bacterium]
MRQLFSALTGSAGRKYGAAVCLILAVFGQQLIKRSEPLALFSAINKTFENWNKSFYLWLENPANVLIGLAVIACAAILFSRLHPPADKLYTPPELRTADLDWSRWKKSLPWLAASLGIYALVAVQLARHRYSGGLVLGWLVSLLIITILFWRNEHKPDGTIQRTDAAWMAVLFALAVVVASYLLNDLPAGWIADELPFWKLARDIALGLKEPPLFDVGVFTFPAASSYLQAWIMRWAGVDFWGWRFASVLPAAGTVIPLYLLTRELFDRRAAIAAGMMMSVNPYFLSFARLGYNNSQVLFPVTLCLYLLTIGIRRNNRFYLWLAGLTAGLGFYTYFAAWLGLVVLVMVFICLIAPSRNKRGKLILPGIVLAGALLALLPRILYVGSGDLAVSLGYKIWETGPVNTFYGRYLFGDERIAQAHVFKINDVEVFYDLRLYGILLLRGIVRTAAVLFDLIGYDDHQIFTGLTGIGSSLFFILGMGVALANSRRLEYLIPSVWFLAGFFFLGVIASIPPRPTHMVALIPVFAMISAIGLMSLLDVFAGEEAALLKNARLIKNWAGGGILIILAVIGLFQYFVLMPYVLSPVNEDDYISWLGRQIPEPANFILVDHNAITRNPRDESLGKLIKHRILLLTSADLEARPEQVKTWDNFAAFFSTQSGRDFAEEIAAQIPDSILQMGYAPGRRLRGYIVTDLKINTSMDVNYSNGMADLWNSPVRSILLLCGAIILGLSLLEWKQRTSIE